ncbi:MAG: 3'(2'),5'-bisphosphate nucleotidase [Sulfobacillus thermosulfidooxidans]|nr:MAG: 3'(2'),5'-bisphosphate nucleotidase [Sulfobacillus thermosulfidooxidans]
MANCLARDRVQTSPLRRGDRMEIFESMADRALHAVWAAREKILEVMTQPFAVNYKSDQSPVTAADVASQEVLVHMLQHDYPHIPIISEETTAKPYEVRNRWKMLWLIDPLDGTKEFVRGNGEFTINVALIADNHPVVAIIDWPEARVTYKAVAGKGAYRIAQNHVQAINSRPLTQPCRAIISRSHRQSEVEWLNSVGLAEHSLSLMGSALKFCRVAEGEADIYPRLMPNMEWDSAAGQLLIEEAGGKVVDLHGEPLTYNKVDLHNDGFIAVGDWKTWGPYLHAHDAFSK